MDAIQTVDGEQSREGFNWATRAQAVVVADAAAVLAAQRSVRGEVFLAVARAFLRCDGKILVTGSGTSGTIAERAAHLLSVGGTPAFYLSPADGLHGGLGVLQRGDWVLALSKGGRSRELNDFCQRARALCSGLVCLTEEVSSPLASLADYVIELRLPAGSDLGGIVATGSSLATAAVTDALVEVCRQARNYDWERLLFTHPAGAVGADAVQSLHRLASADAATVSNERPSYA